MVPQVVAIIHVTFPAHERGRVYAGYGAMVGLAGVCGPPLGGLLVAGDLCGLGRRPIFLVNLPVGAAGLLPGRRWLRESRAPDVPRADAGSASGLTSTNVQLGSAIGSALVTLALLGPMGRGSAMDTQAFSTAFQRILVWVIGFMAAMFALMFALPKNARDGDGARRASACDVGLSPGRSPALRARAATRPVTDKTGKP
ncbi:MFS transporter [Kitasatospora sp. NPDC101155]|uniref:MFS transporter n=1 Tax=Kitasatospora sp. NPDC101155 TaxID=3364097 RepID=UPI0038281928